MARLLSAIFCVASVLSQRVDVFTGGQEGYACYRIPSIVYTANNTLLAFAEARKYSCGDHGYVDLVYKRSDDYGATWSSLTVLYSNSTSQTDFHTIGNPSPVQDRTTGTIWMLFCKDNKAIYASSSDDDGRTFSLPPTELTAVNNADWNWVATGPPAGIQLTSGRFVIPLDASVPGMYSTKGYVVYSDDHGASWKMSSEFGTNDYWPNESQAVQLSNGSVFINSRTGKNDTALRLGSISNDGGATFTETHYIEGLTDTVGGCEGSMVRAQSNGKLYYSGLTPSSSTSNRANLTLHVSADEGNTWQFFEMVEPGSAAYSSLAEIEAQGRIADLYERDSYKYISFMSWDITV